MNAIKYNSKSDNNELSVNEIVTVLNELVEYGIKKVSISGGEPFLKELEKIIDDTNKEMKLSITSNGTILSDKFIRQFRNNENIKLTISLDSLINEKSNKIRKNININKVIDNIKKICMYEDARKKLSIRTTISKINYDEIYDIIKFCEDNKIRNLKVNSTNEFGRAKENKDLLVPFKEFMALLEELVKYCNDNVKNVNVELPVEKYLKGVNRKCQCGITSLYINWNGDVYPCAFTEGNLNLGNIRQKKITEILNDIDKFSHNNEICNRCPINRYKDYDKKTKEIEDC